MPSSAPLALRQVTPVVKIINGMTPIQQLDTCSVIHAMASITRATISERRMARNARFTDNASVVLPAAYTAVLFLIPAVSISRYFYRINDLSVFFRDIISAQTKSIIRKLHFRV